MWTCEKCGNEVDDRFDACPECGSGKNGSEPDVNTVRKKDALQPKIPAAGPVSQPRKNILILSIIILILLMVAGMILLQ